jgi:hypothetical protein
MNSISETITQVCEDTHVPMVQAVFGAPGVDAVFQIMEAAKTLYKHVELERVSGRVVIYRVVSPPGTHLTALCVGPAADFAGLANYPLVDLILEIAGDGRAYTRTLSGQTVEELAQSAVVYCYFAGHEEFLAGSQRKTVLRLDSSARSQFSVPTFSNLREALQHYARENVRESTCYIFQLAWHDPNRLFLKAKPEGTIRNSLTQFLRNRLGGDHDVWPEQNVDESHPVDIRLKPHFSNNRLMLVEIKWLGWSAATDGHITARHGNPRAQEGADQLAQYLDDQLRFAPSSVVQGYFVIIDARRHDLHEGDTSISTANGLYFEDKDLDFNPAQHQTRRDFDPPYRMFARPICHD